MSSQVTLTRPASPNLSDFVAATIRKLERIPVAIPQVIFRLAMANIFWRSGQTKLANWDLTIQLFRDEYMVPILPPEIAAYLATTVEHVTPVMLVLGLGARLGAAAMLAMTLVIQLFVYPQSYPDHLLWAGPLLFLVMKGPGVLSIDHILRRRFA
jgi:putative oxidoreductase